MSSTPPTPDAGAGGSRRAGLASCLRIRNFRLLWIGAFLSSIGTWTQDVALAWLIHTQFHNPLYLGLQNVAANGPLLGFMLIGGAVADRIDRRTILLTSQFLQMTFAASLALLYFIGVLGLVPILVAAFLTGLAQSQSAPTYQAVITSLVPADHIPSAVALNSLQFNLSRAIGPALAGILLVRAGTGACLVTNALSFVAVIIALWRIEIPSPKVKGQSLTQSLAGGFRHVGQSPILRSLTLLGIAASFLAFPLITYLPVLADELFGGGALGFSRLLSSFGVGAIVGALVTAHRGSAPGRGRTMLVSLALYGILVVAAFLLRSQAASTALLLLAGASLVSGFSILNSLVQENTPDAMRGRILSIYGLAFRGGMPLGSLLAGLLIAPNKASWVIGAFSLVLVVIGAGFWAWNPRVRNL